MINPEDLLDIKLRGENLEGYLTFMESALPKTEIHMKDCGGVVVPSPKVLSEIYREGAGEHGHDKRGSDDYDTGNLMWAGVRLEVKDGVSFLSIKQELMVGGVPAIKSLFGLSGSSRTCWEVSEIGTSKFAMESLLSTEDLIMDSTASEITAKELKLLNMLVPDFIVKFEDFMGTYRKSLAKAYSKSILNNNVAESTAVLRKMALG